MRIVGWNIRAGGGRRGEALGAQIGRWRPDVVALSEFRGTLPSTTLARVLGDLGLTHQLATCDSAAPGANCLLVASRWPLRPMRRRAAPREPGRWLLASVAGPHPFTVGALHVPNRVTGRKWEFLDAVLEVARRWREGPAVLVGDTNSGRPVIDEEVPAFNRREGAWIEGLERAGWADAFRHLRGDERAYTWYSPNGDNGFRIDQAFVHRSLLERVAAVRYEWGRERAGTARTAALSDHAAIIVDVRDGGGPPP